MRVTDIEPSIDQERAISSPAMSLVVVAPAGAGKTEVLTRRIERILVESEDDGYRVLALTYTIKASDELRDRLRDRLGDQHRRVDADTTHGFALSLLRLHGTRIGLPSEPEVLARDADRIELFVRWIRETARELPEDPAAALAAIDIARARSTDAPYLDDWRAALESEGSLDYPAMIDRAAELVQTRWVASYLHRLYGHVAVDEAQNLSRAQYRLVSRILGEPGAQRVAATFVGDERQSIVRFAGADETLLGEFQRGFGAERIELRTNFRSARRIVEVGRRVASRLGLPPPDDNFDYPAAGSVTLGEFANERAEGAAVAKWVQDLLILGLERTWLAPGESIAVRPEDIAILARAGGSLRFVREALANLEIPTATASTEADWVRSVPAQALLCLVAHLASPDRPSAARRLARLCGVSEDATDPGIVLTSAQDPDVVALLTLLKANSVEWFIEETRRLPISNQNWLDDLDQIEGAWLGFIDRHDPRGRTFGSFSQHIARTQRGDNLSPGVRLLTVHKAQGREFRCVAIIGCNEGQLPDFRATSEADLRDELRVFYVATSRATRTLRFSRGAARETRFGPRTTTPSRFLPIALSPGGPRLP